MILCFVAALFSLLARYRWNRERISCSGGRGGAPAPDGRTEACRAGARAQERPRPGAAGRDSTAGRGVGVQHRGAACRGAGDPRLSRRIPAPRRVRGQAEGRQLRLHRRLQDLTSWVPAGKHTTRQISFILINHILRKRKRLVSARYLAGACRPSIRLRLGQCYPGLGGCKLAGCCAVRRAKCPS